MARSTLGGAPLFEGLPLDVLLAIDEALTPRTLQAGEWLFQRGDAADRLSIVRWGRFEVIVDERRRTLGPGALIGEVAFLTGEPRSASVRAVRDSEVLELSFERFAAILEEHSGVALSLARVLSRRVERWQDVTAVAPRPSVFALVATRDAEPGRVADEIASAMSAIENVLVVSDPGDDDTAAFGRALDRAERDGTRVVLRAAPGGGAWPSFVLRQADRVVIVADAASDPGAATPGCELVLCGGPAARWLDASAPRAHHIVGTRTDDCARAARRLLGRSIGLVLSGGGARALAHLGVLEELGAAGIEIDRVGGTSMGAFVAGLFALGRTTDEMRDICARELVRGRPFSDYTVPRTSLIKARRATVMVRRVFGDATIEDLERPMFAVAADLLSGERIVTRRGPVHEAVAASMSLPGLVPPIARDGRLLVDGGVLDNLPVEVMADDGEGPVIAVDVVRRVAPGGQTGRPSLVETLARSTVLGSLQRAEASRAVADLVITPDVHDMGLMEFRSIDRAVEAGRAAARDALAAHPGFGR